MSVSGSEECTGCAYEAPDGFTIFLFHFFFKFAVGVVDISLPMLCDELGIHTS